MEMMNTTFIVSFWIHVVTLVGATIYLLENATTDTYKALYPKVTWLRDYGFFGMIASFLGVAVTGFLAYGLW